MASCTVCTTRAAPASAALPCAVVCIVFAGSGAVSAEGHQRRVRGPGGIALRVRIKRCLVLPELEQNKLVGVQGTLKDLILLTAGFRLYRAAAVGHGLDELGALPRLGIRGDDETDRHGLLLIVSRVTATASSGSHPGAQGRHT